VLNRLFKALLRLFPSDFREDFGKEMEQVFRAQHSESPGVGWRALTAVVKAAPGEHWASFLQDSRVAFRSMQRSPGFSAVAALTIALGIGATAAIFSIVDVVLLQPLPYPDSHQLMRVRPLWRDFGPGASSIPEYLDVRAQSRTIESAAAYSTRDINIVVGQGDAERTQAGLVTEGLFDLLKVKPALGRTFVAEDHRDGERPLVISFGFWMRRFGGDPAVVGKEVVVEGQSFSVIGVMPRGFYFPEKTTELWGPIVIRPQDLQARSNHNRTTIVRSRSNVTLTEVESDIAAVGRAMVQANPKSYPQDGSFSLQAIPLHELVVQKARPTLYLLMCAAGFLLLIACGNVASLMLARSAARRGELALRTALGARTGRIRRQLITESFWLSFAGGLAGLVLAAIVLSNLGLIVPPDVQRIDEARVDLRVVLFTLVIVAATSLFFGILPARRATQASIIGRLQSGVRSIGDRQGSRTRTLVVVLEIGLATVLLISAGLTLRSLNRLLHVNPGVITNGVMSSKVTLANRYTPAMRSQFFGALFESLRTTPGVLAAGAVSVLPLSGETEDWAFAAEGYLPPDGEPLKTEQTRIVAGDYFQVLGIPLLSGRTFDPHDNDGHDRVAVVSDSFARKYWGSETAVGKRVKLFSTRGDGPWITVVGVVGDVRHLGLHTQPQPMIYYPFDQASRPMMTIVMRSTADSASSAGVIRNAVRTLDSQQPLYAFRSLEDYAATSISHYRFTSLVLSGIGVLALLLATVGVYGLMAFSVLQRRHEFGLRMALGAERSQIVRDVVKQGLTLAAAGIALGIAGAMAIRDTMQKQLFEVQPTDPASFAGVAILLIVVALAACILPARRATSVDPATALRSE
jgi:predicted permease